MGIEGETGACLYGEGKQAAVRAGWRPKRNTGREGPKEQRAESPSVPDKSLREDTGRELEERPVCLSIFVYLNLHIECLGHAQHL